MLDALSAMGLLLFAAEAPLLGMANHVAAGTSVE